jgi:hypothetical protein
MTGVTQTVPNYFSGMSEQPDYIKSPGQVKNILNGIPDLTYGLYKRPGSKRLKDTPLTNVASGGSWFHYYRDATEGSYVGQIKSDGTVRVWSCTDGAEKTVTYGSGLETSIKSYLSTSTPNDLQFLTINDTTFVNNSNSTKTTALTAATAAGRPHTYAAFVELTKTENGRQYSLNINSNDTTSTLKTATRIEIQSNTQPDPGSNAGQSTGHCPGIGTKVFDITDGSRKNLIFRLTVRGQQGPSNVYFGNNDDNFITPVDYTCSYTNELILLHGGEDWETGDTYTVTLEGYNYTIRVADHEATKQQADIKAVRPAPTPFDSDTAVSATHIIGGLVAELDGVSNISYTVIGNGIYIYSTNQAFNVQVVENDLMKAITLSCDDVTDLPNQCKHGYIVKVANTKSDEDDYYLRFEGENGKDGNGSWVECAKPGVTTTIDPAKMPITIQRVSASTFNVDHFDWKLRDVGDTTTNPEPSFIGKPINRVLFWRNRLVLLSGENAIISRPGDFGNFWVNTALAVSNSDPIDIACSSSFPSDLWDGIEMTDGLLIFSSDQQFLLSTSDSSLTPETAKMVSVATYNFNRKISPISLGPTIGYLDNSGQYSRFFEIANVSQTREPDIVDQTKVVSRLIPNDIDLLSNSRENSTIIIGKSGTDTVYGYRYYSVGQRRLQSAWFTWKLVNPIKYQFIIDDAYYFVDDDNFLQRINFIQASGDPLLTQDGDDYLLHLDNYTSITGGSYSANTNKTTFTASWLSSVTTPNGDLCLIDDDETASRSGNYTKPTVSGTSIVADGDWSGITIKVGYLYDYKVEFPRFYVTRAKGEVIVSDVSASLVLHRIKLALGKVGLYESILKRVGKTDYTELYESTTTDNYEGDNVPYLMEKIQTIPVYEKNENVDLTVKSTHPSPATIRSLSWEGDYSNKFYKRV